jgi:cytochrome c-type biogenesis protein CcmH/NrfG
VAVFQMNVEMYPDSSNVYDSLGEGLAALDKKEEAIKAYAKSLELDPKNRNAVEWLDKLTK